MGTYRGALKETDRLGVRMSSRIGGAGGYLHWVKYRERREPMPCAIVMGCAPGGDLYRAAKISHQRGRNDDGRRSGRARRSEWPSA